PPLYGLHEDVPEYIDPDAAERMVAELEALRQQALHPHPTPYRPPLDSPLPRQTPIWRAEPLPIRERTLSLPAILRIADGVLVENRDVIQDEAVRGQSRSGRPMFGGPFPVYR